MLGFFVFGSKFLELYGFFYFGFFWIRGLGGRGAEEVDDGLKIFFRSVGLESKFFRGACAFVLGFLFCT